jgi:hypothetical protein
LRQSLRKGIAVIYEIRTYTCRPGQVAEWEKRWAEAFTASSRGKYSMLGGLWHTDVGPLNQLIHIWPYESMQQRADVRSAAAKDPSGKWPPEAATELLVSQESDILDPIKNMTDWSGPQTWGSIYELRMYTYPPGGVGRTAAAMSEAYAARDAIYPIAGIFTSQLGNLNRLYQLFPYKDWNHRDEVRAEMRKQGVWPPRAEGEGPGPVSQLVRYLIPAQISPLH